MRKLIAVVAALGLMMGMFSGLGLAQPPEGVGPPGPNGPSRQEDRAGEPGPPDWAGPHAENDENEESDADWVPPGRGELPPGLQDRGTPPGLEDKGGLPPGLQGRDNLPPGIQMRFWEALQEEEEEDEYEDVALVMEGPEELFIPEDKEQQEGKYPKTYEVSLDNGAEATLESVDWSYEDENLNGVTFTPDGNTLDIDVDHDDAEPAEFEISATATISITTEQNDNNNNNGQANGDNNGAVDNGNVEENNDNSNGQENENGENKEEITREAEMTVNLLEQGVYIDGEEDLVIPENEEENGEASYEYEAVYKGFAEDPAIEDVAWKVILGDDEEGVQEDETVEMDGLEVSQENDVLVVTVTSEAKEGAEFEIQLTAELEDESVESNLTVTLSAAPDVDEDEDDETDEDEAESNDDEDEEEANDD